MTRVGAILALLLLASCGARSALFAIARGDGDGDAGRDAGGPDANDAGPSTDAGAEEDATSPIDDATPDCSTEPCLCAPTLAAGETVAGTTCGAVNPNGSTCSESSPTVFYRFEIPAQSELPLNLSANLMWGVLCKCPDGPGPGCCVGPSGTTGPSGVGTDLANMGSTPLLGVLALSRTDVPCGAYTVSLGP